MYGVSVVCLTRNAPRLAAACLDSLLRCIPELHRHGDEIEFVLVDDCSDERTATIPVLRQFKSAADVRGGSTTTTLVRFRRPMHYSAGLAYAFSRARGEMVLFVSHDMVVPPRCIAELLAVARRDARIGVVRPTSEHMDWAKSFVQLPPGPPCSFEDVAAFAEQVGNQFASMAVPWPMLIGDAMLVKRSVIDRIGVFDPRFYAYVTDIDYSIRLHRAGFVHAIARGAWLHHEGGGAAKESAASGGASIAQQSAEMLQQVQAAYDLLREKWGGGNLPPHFRDMKRTHFEALHALPGELRGDEFVPPLTLGEDIAEVIE